MNRGLGKKGICRMWSIGADIFRPLAGCVYLENTSDSWDIPWYAMRKGCITT